MKIINKFNIISYFMVILSLMFLVACGTEGGSGGGDAPPPNSVEPSNVEGRDGFYMQPTTNGEHTLILKKNDRTLVYFQDMDSTGSYQLDLTNSNSAYGIKFSTDTGLMIFNGDVELNLKFSDEKYYIKKLLDIGTSEYIQISPPAAPFNSGITYYEFTPNDFVGSWANGSSSDEPSVKFSIDADGNISDGDLSNYSILNGSISFDEEINVHDITLNTSYITNEIKLTGFITILSENQLYFHVISKDASLNDLISSAAYVLELEQDP